MIPLLLAHFNKIFKTMIKTYIYTQPMNNISHVLTGQSGNTVRFNFTNGNILTKKQPELTLKGKYFQDLLENSELMQKGLVRLIRTVEEDCDKVDADKKTEGAPSQVDGKEEVPSVKSTDELIAYINERFGKDYRTLASAMKCASTNNIIFPNYEP